MKKLSVLILLHISLLVACKNQQNSNSEQDPLSSLHAVWTTTDSEIAAEELTKQLAETSYFQEIFAVQDSVIIKLSEIEVAKKIEFDAKYFREVLIEEFNRRNILINEKVVADWTIRISVNAKKGKENNERFWLYDFQLDIRNADTYTTVKSLNSNIKKYY